MAGLVDVEGSVAAAAAAVFVDAVSAAVAIEVDCFDIVAPKIVSFVAALSYAEAQSSSNQTWMLFVPS